MPVERLVPGKPAVLRPPSVVRGPLRPPLPVIAPLFPVPSEACGPAITRAPPCSARAAPGGKAAAVVDRPAGNRDCPSVDNPALRDSVAAGADVPPAASPSVPPPEPLPRTEVDREAEGTDPVPPLLAVIVPATPVDDRSTADESGPDASTALPDARLAPADATATSPA